MRPAAALLLVALALSRADAAPSYDWVLTLENGDVLHVSPVAIEGTRLVVRWEVSPDEPLRLELKAVSFLSRATEDGQGMAPLPDQDMLRLHDDSVLYGRATSIRPEAIEIDVPQVGRLTVPAENILDLTRGGRQVQPPDTRDGEFSVTMKSGVTIAGRMLADDGGRMAIEGNGIAARIDPDQLAVLVFPRPAPREESGEPPAAGIEIKLRNGSVVAGREPSLAEGTLRFKAGGVDAAVPVADVASISFREYGATPGRAGLRTVLAWGRWSDPDEEFRRTIDALKSLGESRWDIQESMADRYDDAFRRKLFTARVLLVPEMERMPPAPTDGAEMRPVVEAFLRSGGNVVVCGASQPPHFQWLRDAGLIDLESAGQVDGVEVTFTAKGASAGKGITAYQAVNATHAYAIRSRDAISLAEANGKPVVVGRRIGRGWVIVVGPDYFMTNEGASKLLGNLVGLR
ncbi:MAG: hypothetical protein L6Q95_10050 [Planctomycetes bacterium]|nr:hypothetical protein [Planctomycetota bacterium]